MRRLAAVLLLTGLFTGLAGPAAAQTAPEPGVVEGVKDYVKDAIVNDPFVKGAGGAVGETICPSQAAPPVQAPSLGMPWSEPGGQTQFQKYGYAGLRITTRDQGCLAQIKASGASGFNDVVNSVDELINALQVGAVSDSGTSAVEAVLPKALEGLRDAFWLRWMPAVAALGGVLILGYGLLARSTAAGAFGVNLIVVLGLVPWILGNSHYITDASHALTTETATAVSEELLQMHPSTAGDSAAAAYGDGYYQIAWRAHLEQQFQSHEECAVEYAPKFVAATAFSYDEMERMKGNAALGKKLVEEKNAEWQRLADDMAEKQPACYATWSNPANAWSGVGKHAAVTAFGGSWLALFGLAVQAVEFMLLFGLVVLAGVGVVMLVRQALTSSYLGLLLMGVIGPAVLSILSGSLIFFFYVVISDPATAWYHAIIAGACMAVGAALALRVLGPALIGVAAGIGMTSRSRRRGTRRMNRRVGQTAAAAVAGATVGRAAGKSGGKKAPPVDAPAPKRVGFEDASADADVRVTKTPDDVTDHTAPAAATRPTTDPDAVPFHDPLGDDGVGPRSDAARQDWHHPQEADVPEPDTTTTRAPDDLSAWANTQVPEPKEDLVKSTYAAYAGRRTPPIGEGTTAPVDS